MLFKVVAAKIADGRCEKKKNQLNYIYLQIIIQFQSMLFKLNICKVLTSTTKNQQNSTKTIFWKQQPTLSSLTN